MKLNLNKIEMALKAIDHEVKELKVTVAVVEDWLRQISDEIEKEGDGDHV